jgi:hypothetical protein
MFYAMRFKIDLSKRDYQNGNKGITVMVFNAIFNNISVTSRRTVLMVEETGVPLTLCKSLTNCIT